MLQTSSQGKLGNVRLWIARSATPDFGEARWEAVPMRDADVNPGNGSAENVFKLAEVNIGPPAMKYLVARGEVEVIAGNGSLERFSSAQIVLPKIKTWSQRKADGSRSVYIQPSEEAQSVRLWVAQSATRDFSQAKWQAVPATPEKETYWRNYRVNTPAASKQTPWVAVYAETEFKGAPGPERVLSSTLIWNGLPLPTGSDKTTLKVCPLHRTDTEVIPVIYGMPGPLVPENAIMGGCIVGPGIPLWHCNLCDCSWGDGYQQFTKNRPQLTK